MKRAAPWLAALAGLGLTLLAFWPGYLSWDSAWQWWQARTGELDPAHPPVMVRVWQLSRLALPDPGGMLLLQATLWWSALAAFAQALGGGAWRRAGTVLFIGAWPPLLALLPHLWKDLWMMGCFALAVALLAAELRAPRPALRVAAVLVLGAGVAFRLNALPAALPLLAWVAWRQWPGRKLRWTAMTLLLAIVVQGVSWLANAAPGQRDVPVWPAVALWDIAAVSIAEDELLVPEAWVEPGLGVDELRRDFSPFVNVPSFASGRLRLNFDREFTPAQYAQLREAWLALPLRHPRAYLAHRLELSAYLLGLRQAAHPDFLVLQPTIVPLRDNPAVAPPAGALHARLQPALDALVDTPLFAAWPYLLASLALAAFAAWRRAAGDGLVLATAASAWALALPLFLLAPSSDFRYLGWCLLAALMAAALAFRPPRPSAL